MTPIGENHEKSWRDSYEGKKGPEKAKGKKKKKKEAKKEANEKNLQKGQKSKFSIFKVADGGLIFKSLVQKVSFGPVEHQYPYFFAIFWSQKRGGQLLWVPMRESDP